MGKGRVENSTPHALAHDTSRFKFGTPPHYIYQFKVVTCRRGFNWPKLQPLHMHFSSHLALNKCISMDMARTCGIN
jgi:hypothetical protein